MNNGDKNLLSLWYRKLNYRSFMLSFSIINIHEAWIFFALAYKYLFHELHFKMNLALINVNKGIRI